MIGFSMLGSNDISRARRFYDALMPEFGASLRADWSTDTRLWYAAGSASPMLAITTTHDAKPATVGNGSMVALALPSHQAVNAAHTKALALGAADEGGPGFRSNVPGDLYRAYFRDPDGNKLMVFAAPQNSS